MKKYKCQGACGKFKPASKFYITKARPGTPSESERASPYCIECNPSASLLNRYKAEIRRTGSKAFALRIRQKENQLRLMLQAAQEVRV